MKTRTITIKKKDLFYDIDKLSLSLSKVSGSDDVRRSDAIATDTASDERAFTRLTDKRAGELRTLLREFLATTTATSVNDLLSTGDYVFALSVPDALPDNTLDGLVAGMHDYIVKGAMADWYVNVGAGPAAALLEEAQTAYGSVRELIYHRPIPEMI